MVTSYGLQVIGDHGRIQIDQDFKAPRLIMSGSSTTEGPLLGGVNEAVVTLPYSVTLEPPLVFVRPSQPDKFVGCFSLAAPAVGFSGSNGFYMAGQCPFDYAVFSSQGTPFSDGSTYGLEVYTADGAVAYSSRHSHPRIRSIAQKVATTAADGGYPNQFSISGFSQMPWIMANPLILTAFGVGPDSETMGCVMAAVNSNYTQLSIDLRSVGPGNGRLGDYLSNVNDYNPYYNLPAWFAVAMIDG